MWSSEWPTDTGWYWFYGQRFKNEPKTPRLQVVKVEQAMNSAVYLCNGTFMYRQEGASGFFQALATPELP